MVASHPEITPPTNFHHFRDTTGGYVFFNNLNFAYELARQRELVITRSNGEKMVVDLTGSSDAIDAMIVCQVATMK